MKATEFAERFDPLRGELARYLARLTLRPDVADELVQDTALRALQNLDKLPATHDHFRAWIYRVATNLGLDHCRKSGTVRETVMSDLRARAEGDSEFAAKTLPLRGTAEMAAIAREHLAACIACSLHRFPPPQAAAMLLVEMVGFSVDETAEVLEARPAQVKGWLTTTRAATEEHFGRTCALVAKQGVCYQCVELDRLHGANRGNPLQGTGGRVEDRMSILRDQPPARWTRLLAELLDDLG
jgi:RNA polymerase sigma-70 factor (ECF subfamily)